ncbi:MAG: oxidoreductase [Sulfobacillus acidophilus]|uniref:Oxidoreductase n=1 Tax=Sulfobacillus acidophilus TaxID=53633 RepID=A0A2T2WID8_9FIRM|nr:MAG: oxidoreductase [Sulfobacillus acidophilus]
MSHFKHALQIRHVDAGSCNGCEQELTALTSQAYDWQRFGLDIVASARHADALLVTGPTSDTMARPLTHVFNAIASPKIRIAFGDCAAGCGVFENAYAVHSQRQRSDLVIRGCPPDPEQALDALRNWMQRSRDSADGEIPRPIPNDHDQGSQEAD